MTQLSDLYSLSLHELPIAVVDLETTGLHPDRDAICEIGAVQIKGGRIISRYATLVNPQRDIPEHVIDIHHLTPEMLKDAPLIDDVIPLLLHFLRDSAIAGHNAAFDLGFLAPHVRKLGVDLNQRPVLDTAFLARKLLPGYQSYALSKLADAIPLPPAEFHRALDDAITTAHLLHHVFDAAQQQSIHTLAALNEQYKPSLILKSSDELSAEQNMILDAIEHKLTLDIKYSNREGEATERRVSPERLQPPYLYAFCHLREEQRCFRLSRIASIAPSPPKKQTPTVEKTNEKLHS
jgi:DNA polymerase III epsilon subunit family exonuclease